MTAYAIEIRRLTKDYGPRRVLDIDHFAVGTRSVCVVVGPNGSGKTTLLKVLSLLEPQTAGRVLLWGEPVGDSPAADRRLRRRVVMVREQPWMFHTTVLGNVSYGLTARGIGRQEARRRAVAALETVGMAHAADWLAPALSAGEARRTALARALVVEPELVLLDEPLADVDAQQRVNVERIIRELPARGTTVLVTTHRLDAAYRLAGRCVSLVHGRLHDALPDNHFSGTIVEAEGEPVMPIAPGCRLHLATPLRGPAHVVIDPRTVILSRPPPATSARNCFAGHVAGLAVEADRVRVTVDVGVPIIALITERSFREMRLELGEPISVVFKTLSLDVYGGKPA